MKNIPYVFQNKQKKRILWQGECKVVRMKIPIFAQNFYWQYSMAEILWIQIKIVLVLKFVYGTCHYIVILEICSRNSLENEYIYVNIHKFFGTKFLFMFVNFLKCLGKLNYSNDMITYPVWQFVSQIRITYHFFAKLNKVSRWLKNFLAVA